MFSIWNLWETRIKKFRKINICQYLPWKTIVSVNYSEYIFLKWAYLENYLQACSVFVLHQPCVYACVWADEWVEANCRGECSMDISSHEDQTRGKILIILLPWNFEWVSNHCARFQNHTQEQMCWRIFILRRIVFTVGTEEEARMCASTHVCVCRIFLGVFTVQREDYCRFTRPEDNEQTHLWDTFSISNTMKHH